MDMSIYDLVGVIGTPASLAVWGYLFKVYHDDRKHTERRLTGLLERDQESREELTKAITGLSYAVNERRDDKR